MRRSKSIKLQAAFLLLVFAMNTVVGFACAVGIDMGFNSKHHQDREATEAVVHVHKDGKRHLHKERKEKLDQGKSHHQDEANNHHKTGKGKNDCCSDKVINFEQLDKSVPNSISILNPVFFTAFVTSHYTIYIVPYSNVVTNKKQFVRGHHPPIQDIRIAIQSFQV